MSGVTILSIALRPFVALLLFAVAAYVGRSLAKRIPPGRIKNVLTRPMHIVPRNEADRRDWWPVFWLIVPILLLMALILFAHNSPIH